MSCNYWGLSGRCPAMATVTLVAPDAAPVPGGYYCSAHGQAVIDEYHKVLGEEWTLRRESGRRYTDADANDRTPRHERLA